MDSVEELVFFLLAPNFQHAPVEYIYFTQQNSRPVNYAIQFCSWLFTFIH